MNLFNTNLANTIQTKGSSFMDAGIHENVTLVSYRIDKSPNGNDFLELTYEDATGKQLKQTEYAPFQAQTQEENVINTAKKVKRLMDIVECFYPKGSQSFETPTYVEFCKKVVELLDNADKSTKLRIKAVYQQNGFVSVPKQAQYTYIERMDVEKSNISILSIDIMERPVVADKEDLMQNGFETFTQGNATIINGNITIETDANSDLPF